MSEKGVTQVEREKTFLFLYMNLADLAILIIHACYSAMCGLCGLSAQHTQGLKKKKIRYMFLKRRGKKSFIDTVTYGYVEFTAYLCSIPTKKPL